MKKFENFCLSLANLQDVYRYDEPYDNVVLTGLVALYEICFEQAWKAMKEILQNNGVDEAQTGSPRQVLKTAYHMGMIHNEELWLSALLSRNNVAHAYNRKIALEIVAKTKADYCRMFLDLKSEIEKNWTV